MYTLFRGTLNVVGLPAEALAKAGVALPATPEQACPRAKPREAAWALACDGRRVTGRAIL